MIALVVGAVAFTSAEARLMHGNCCGMVGDAVEFMRTVPVLVDFRKALQNWCTCRDAFRWRRKILRSALIAAFAGSKVSKLYHVSLNAGRQIAGSFPGP